MKLRRTHVPAAAVLVGIACAAEASVATPAQAGQQFSKKALTAKSGEIVRYRNGDDAIRTINAIDAVDVARDMGLQKPGEHIEVLFDKNGTFVVRCGIHPKMKMVVTAE